MLVTVGDSIEHHSYKMQTEHTVIICEHIYDILHFTYIMCTRGRDPEVKARPFNLLFW